ncbi:MAG: N-acetylmuramoyl-L-alanine amidase [Oscillospiraceae bacterium]|jgi:N-acetylmuramoyl-L-alanine amidase|nr:N-acetylmuramoyl-L-alanine amidase [Oscillospiraceae bacterium]
MLTKFEIKRSKERCRKKVALVFAVCFFMLSFFDKFCVGNDAKSVKDSVINITLDLSVRTNGTDKVKIKSVDYNSDEKTAHQVDLPLIIGFDPGHGGRVPGAVCYYEDREILEKDLNLKVVKYAMQGLSNYTTSDGKAVCVASTHNLHKNKLEPPSLTRRIEFLEHASVIISVHFNSSLDKTQRGCFGIVTGSTMNPDVYKESAKLALLVVNNLNKKVGIPIGKTCNFNNNKRLEMLLTRNSNGTSKTLADRASISNGILRRPSDDGDVYPNGDPSDYYAIIRNAYLKNKKAILIECCHISNEEDLKNFVVDTNYKNVSSEKDVENFVVDASNKNIVSKEKLKKISKAIVLAVKDYFGLVKLKTITMATTNV